MKRFTLILSLMVAMVTTAMAQVTSLDQITDDKVYTIESQRGFLMYEADLNSTGLITTNARVATPTAKIKNSSNPKQQFQIKTVDGQRYLYSVAAGKYFAEGNTLTDTPTNALTIKETTNGTYNWYLQVGSHGLNTQDPGQHDYGIIVSSYTTEDAGNRFRIVDVAEPAGFTPNAFKGFDMGRAYSVTSTTRGAWTVNDTQFTSTTNSGQAVDATNTKQQFVLLTLDGVNYYLYNVGAGKFANADRSLTDTPKAPLRITACSGTYAGRLLVSYDDNSYINLNGESNLIINDYDTIDEGNAMLFTEVAAFTTTDELLNKLQTVEVTYNFKYNGEIYCTEVVNALPGSTYPGYNAILPWGVSATIPNDVVAEGAHEKDVELTVTNPGLPFEAVESGNPAKWYYAQLHTNFKSYLRVNDDDKLYWKVNNALITTFGSEDVNDYSWGFVGDRFGGFKLVNPNGEGVKMADDGTVTTVPVAEATNFIATSSQVNNQLFCLYAQNADKHLNAQATIQGWKGNDAGSTFTLTERDFDVEISELGYSTLYMGRKVYIPEGVEAYIVTSEGLDDGFVTLTQVTGVLPANQGVILKKENGGDFTFVTATENATANTEGNMLTGSVAAAEITKEDGKSYYILANGVNGVGLYNPTIGEDATKFNNAANKAYLVVPASEGAEGIASYSFRFGEETTGVEKVEIRNEKSEIYDLTGRRVENPSNGIYIINGVKVLVK